MTAKKKKTIEQKAEEITQVIADNEEKVWIWIGNGYVLSQYHLKDIILNYLLNS